MALVCITLSNYAGLQDYQFLYRQDVTNDMNLLNIRFPHPVTVVTGKEDTK